MQKQIRLSWMDNLRSMAIAGLILIQVSGLILNQFGQVSDLIWWTGNICDSIVRFSVPVLGMIIGATLLHSNESYSEFFKNRFLRLIPPFLFWASVYILFNLSLRYFNGEPVAWNDFPQWAWLQMGNGISVHYWYVYMIVGIYLVIPLMRGLVRKLGDKGVKRVLMVWFALLFLKLPGVSSFIPEYGITFFFFFMGYPLLGYYLATRSFKDYYLVKGFAKIFIGAGVMITAVGTYYITLHNGSFMEDFYNYLSPNVAIASIGIFLLVKYQNVKRRNVNPVSSFISRYSYGIYLIHILVLWLLGTLGLRINLISPALEIVIISFACLFFSGAIIYLVSKLPYGNYVSG